MGADNRCGYLFTGSESDRCIGGRNLMWAFTAKLGNLTAHVNRKAQVSEIYSKADNRDGAKQGQKRP